MIARNYEVDCHTSSTTINHVNDYYKVSKLSPVVEENISETRVVAHPLIKILGDEHKNNTSVFFNENIKVKSIDNGYFLYTSNVEDDLSYVRKSSIMIYVTTTDDNSSLSSRSAKFAKNTFKVMKTLESISYLEKHQSERLASRYLMKGIELGFKNRDVDFVNDLLLAIKNDKLSIRSKAIAIRTTFRARDRLPAWNKVINEFSLELRSKDIDPEEWLVGLI